MRWASVIIVGLLLASCSALPGVTPGAGPAVGNLASQGKPVLQVGILSKKTGTLVALDTVRGPFETWVSADGASITMRDGMMVATRGLGGDMLGSDIDESRAAITRRSPGRVTRFHTFLDGENRAQRRAYICDIADRGPRDVPFGAVSVPAQLIAEDCASQDQAFLNLYWLDQSGRIVQSRQWAGEFAGILTFRIVP